MDEVMYNDRGNRLTMIKRPEESLSHKLIDSLTPDDSPASSSSSTDDDRADNE